MCIASGRRRRSSAAIDAALHLGSGQRRPTSAAVAAAGRPMCGPGESCMRALGPHADSLEGFSLPTLAAVGEVSVPPT